MAESVYTQYYLQQIGHGYDHRFGAPYISPVVLQRGYGLGGIFSTVARYLTPIFGALKDTAVTAGKNVLRDFGHKSLHDILSEQGKLAASTLTDRSAKQLHEWIGAGRSPRKGIKRRATQKGGISLRAKPARTCATKKRKRTVAVLNRGAGRRKSIKRRKRTLDIFS